MGSTRSERRSGAQHAPHPDGDEDQEHGQYYARIPRRGLIDDASQYWTGGQRHYGAECGTSTDSDEHARQYQSHDIEAAGADGETNPNLAFSPRHRIGHEAVDTCGSQQHGQDPERRQRDRGRPAREPRESQELLETSGPVDRHRRVERGAAMARRISPAICSSGSRDRTTSIVVEL